VGGVWYYPQEDYNYDETGIASWYGPDFHGRHTANGEIFDMNLVTAAHRTLPMPSVVRVINLENGRSLIVRVNDRGPFARGRIIDLSRRSAQLLGFDQKGTARVRVQILAEESRALAAQLRGGTAVAAANTPITVDRLPKPAVSREELAPPPGAASAPARVAQAAMRRSANTVNNHESADATLAAAQVGTVTQGAAQATQIYIQAGAFGVFENAHRVQAVLAPLGSVKISTVLVNGRDLFRVRLGPLADVAQADRLLDSVIRAGYPGARVIVD
jgi:rare lipoprotein A